MNGSSSVVRSSAERLPLPDNSVDLVITSPPYYAQRSYTDAGRSMADQIGGEETPSAYIDRLVAATAEMSRVLRPSGSIWVNLGDKYTSQAGRNRGGGSVLTGRSGARQTPPAAGLTQQQDRPKSLSGLPWRYAIRCMDELGLILRAEVIWSKPNGLPESVTDRVRRSHEQWFHFTREPRYFASIDGLREPTSRSGLTWEERKAACAPNRHCDTGGGASLGAPGPKAPHRVGKIPGSVWDVATQPLRVPDHLGVDHFAAFPVEWPLRIITGWSPPGGVVLDPFGGTGTTALAAKVLGRQGISCDLSADYCRIARWRTTDPGQISAARERGRRAGSTTSLTDVDDLGLFAGIGLDG
jgi:site-specific DNA-methyltransferase (cytosine-N4-specific)